MRDHRFDALVRSIAAGPLSRRELLQATAGAVALTTLRNLPAAASPVAGVDFTPAAAQVSADDLLISQKALDLNYDRDAIFQFVAREIEYQPYAGALRGARATLLGRAGNSVDKALLLAALLRASLVETRFAIGPLSEDAAAQLTPTTALDIDKLRQNDARMEVESFGLSLTSKGIQATPVSAFPDQGTIDGLAAARNKQLDIARDQIASTVTLLTTALSGAGVTLPAAETGVPSLERQRHVWVQAANGAEWLDLDPFSADAKPGETLTSAAEVVDAIPADLEHTVRISVAIETIGGDATQRTTVIDRTTNARELIASPITFTHVPPETFKAIGLSILNVIEGTFTSIPTLMIGTEAIAGDVYLSFGAGQGLLDTGSEGLPEGEPIAEWLMIEIASPGAELVSIERAIFDRLGAAARAAGSVDVAALPPIELASDPDLGSYWLPLQAVTTIAVDGAEVTSAEIAPSAFPDNLHAQGQLTTRGMHHLRGRLGSTVGLDNGYRFFPDRPNVSAIVLTPDPANPSGPPILESDVLFTSLRPVAVEAPESAAHPSILAAAVMHAAERGSVEASWVDDLNALDLSGDLQRRPGTSVGRVFEAAAAAGIAARTIVPGDDTETIPLPGSDEAVARMRASLRGGLILVVPESAVEIDGRDVVGWWAIDPTTGAIVDRMENGRGAAAMAFATIGEYALSILNGLRYLQGYRRLMCIGALILAASGVLWGISAAQAGFSGSGSIANAAAAVGSAVGGTLLAPGACRLV